MQSWQRHATKLPCLPIGVKPICAVCLADTVLLAYMRMRCAPWFVAADKNGAQCNTNSKCPNSNTNCPDTCLCPSECNSSSERVDALAGLCAGAQQHLLAPMATAATWLIRRHVGANLPAVHWLLAPAALPCATHRLPCPEILQEWRLPVCQRWVPRGGWSGGWCVANAGERLLGSVLP